MEIIARAAAVFFFLWFLMRVIGKKELSQLSAFELILLIAIGDLVQQGVTQEDMSLTGAFLAAGTMAALVVLLSFVEFRWPRARMVIQGEPAVIVQDGRLLERAMRIERLTVEEVLEAARQEGIGDLGSVEWGILETDGRFSFITRKDSEPEGSESSHD